MSRNSDTGIYFKLPVLATVVKMVAIWNKNRSKCYGLTIFRITEEFTNSESTAQNGRKRRNTPTVFDYNTANTVELAYLVDTRWMRRYAYSINTSIW